jgi:hypothetical protein
MIAWSWSRLDCFEKCPKQFYHKNIKKDFKDDGDNPAFIKGNRIHTKIENALKSGVIDPEIKHLANTIFRLKGMDWTELGPPEGIEINYTFKDNLTRTKWNDWKNAWVRINMDFIGIKDDIAVLIDWKTGKNRGYSEQLDLYAAGAFTAHPELNEVRVSYVFVEEAKGKETEKATYKRHELDSIWQKFGERAELIEIANERDEWPAKQNFGCKWCPVKTCKYQGG